MSDHRTGVDARYVVARERAERAIVAPAAVEATRDRVASWAFDEHMKQHPCRQCGRDGAWTEYRVWGEWCVSACRACLPGAIAADPVAVQLDVEFGAPVPGGGE